MKNSHSVDQDWTLWWWLIHARDAVNLVRQKELDRYNISARKSAVLFAIHFLGDEATPTSIAQLLLRKPNTISEFLDRMEKAELVKRVKKSNHKNKVHVELTEKGQLVFQQSTERESVKKIFSVLSHEDCEQLKSYLQAIRDKALNEAEEMIHPPFPPVK